MNKFISKITMMGCCLALLATAAACSDANEYEDAVTDNPAWSDAHPTSLASTKYVRGTGMKKNVYGVEVQGFIESLDFVSADSVQVKMSQGATEGTWVDDSNTERLPLYEYTYNEASGKIEILKRTVDDNKRVSKSVIFSGVAVTADKDIITMMHFGDTPMQTYLVKQ